MVDFHSRRIRVPTISKTSQLIYYTSIVRYFYLKNWQRFQTLLPKDNIPNTPVVWKEPKKLPFNHPWKTGDLVTENEPVDMTGHPRIVSNSLQSIEASDSVKRMFTFDFLGRRFAQKYIKESMIASVRNHEYDDDSLEAIIAGQTAKIRNLNQHLQKQPYHRPARKHLNRIIFSRYHRLTELRECDYKRFEWLLEKLSLTYQPRPEEKRVPRREESIRELTENYVENYKQGKLLEYKLQLDEQKEEFLKGKVASLIWMRQEEIECGIEEPSITMKEIECAEKQLEDYHEYKRKQVTFEDKSGNILTEL